jgi:hypothetical protein
MDAGTWGQPDDQDKSGTMRAAGMVVASLAAAGLVGYVLKRARQNEASAPLSAAEAAVEQTRDVLGGIDLDAGREFLVKQVLPELKPVLLSALEELEDVLDASLERAKKAVKDL